jgi:hypothetical protein
MAVTVSSQATMQNSLNQFYNSQTLGTRRSDYGSPQSLSFPADLLTKVSYPYYINIKLSNYTRPSIQSVPIAVASDMIKLPIPTQLQVQTGLNYQNVSLGSALGAAVLNSSGQSALNTAGDIGVGVLSYIAKNAIGKLGTEILSKVGAQKTNEAISIASGMSLNPFMAVLFDHPEFRTYNFSWKLMPKNKGESDTLRNIITTLNAGILPTLAIGSLAYNYPKVADISINTPDQSGYLFQFKKAVIKNMTVNYAAGNELAFFRGSSAPAAVEINLQIQEIELWRGEQYQNQYNYASGAYTQPTAQPRR